MQFVKYCCKVDHPDRALFGARLAPFDGTNVNGIRVRETEFGMDTFARVRSLPTRHEFCKRKPRCLLAFFQILLVLSGTTHKEQISGVQFFIYT